MKICYVYFIFKGKLARLKSFKLVVSNNFDFRTRVHEMTEDHQDSVEHWVSMACTENRITDESLSEEVPIQLVISMVENSIFAPSGEEHTEERITRIYVVK